MAAVNLQCDARLMTSNLQVFSQFVTSLDIMSSEVLHLAMGRMVFPSSEVSALSPTPRATRAAHYMASIGLWRSPVGPGGPGWCHVLVTCTVISDNNSWGVPVVFCATLVPCWMLFALWIVSGWVVSGSGLITSVFKPHEYVYVYM